jgi:hypothetical protein
VQTCDTPALIATQGLKTATLKCKIPTRDGLKVALSDGTARFGFLAFLADIILNQVLHFRGE